MDGTRDFPQGLGMAWIHIYPAPPTVLGTAGTQSKYLLTSGRKQVVRAEGCIQVLGQHHPYVHISFSQFPQFVSRARVYGSRWGGAVSKNFNHLTHK